MGLPFAIFRPIAAIVTGLLGGALVLLVGSTKASTPDVPPVCTDPCCSGDLTRPAWRRAIEFGFVTLPRDFGLAAVDRRGNCRGDLRFVPVGSTPGHEYLGNGVVSILILMAAGIPLYVWRPHPYQSPRG